MGSKTVVPRSCQVAPGREPVGFRLTWSRSTPAVASGCLELRAVVERLRPAKATAERFNNGNPNA